MVLCTNCGFDAGESKFCPNCGSEIVIEKSVKTCLNCGNEVGDSAFCPSCGTKLENEVQKVFCPKCGNEVGDSAFCPDCGTKIENEVQKVFCPKCGKEIGNSKFCPHCGFSKSNDDPVNENDKIDTLIDIDEKLSEKMGGLFSKSKSMDFILDKTASIGYKNISKRKMADADRKYYQKIEPVFLEVYDSINDDFVKAILMYERSMMMSSSGGIIGIAASQIYTPTKDMPHDDAVKFYRDMAMEIVNDINKEKQNGTFNEEEFYKKRVKKSAHNNVSVLGISKSVKSFKKNKKKFF